MTDGEGQYRILGPMFAKHEAVNHGIGEYVRGDARTNTVESYSAILKRGITGTFHSQQHLKRHLCEFDFRYNERTALGVEDAERARKAVAGVVGKRVTYQSTNHADARVAHYGFPRRAEAFAFARPAPVDFRFFE